MPSPVGRETLRRRADLGRHGELELVVGDLEERQQLARKDTNVRFVDEGVGEFECAAPDRDVAVAEAVEDDSAVTLDGVRVDRDDLVESVESDVAVYTRQRASGGKAAGDAPNVVVSVAQELAQNVDRHHAQTVLRLDLENGEHRLVEDRVPDVLGRFGVRCDLRRKISSVLASVPTPSSPAPEYRSSPRSPQRLPSQASSAAAAP